MTRSLSELQFESINSLPLSSSPTRVVIHLAAPQSRPTFPSEDALRIAVERYGVLDGGTQTLDRLARTLDQNRPMLTARWTV